MTQFNDRERAFESKFGMTRGNEVSVVARRNRLLANGTKMGCRRRRPNPTQGSGYAPISRKPETKT